VGEFLPGYEASGWFGIGAPKNTSSEVVDQLNKQINEGLADPKMKARFADLGGVPMPTVPSLCPECGQPMELVRTVPTLGPRPRYLVSIVGTVRRLKSAATTIPPPRLQ
jgi:Tripartite tricarboxylate transporter family receptor